MPESRPVETFPASMIEGVREGQPVVVEIHDNGYAYVRPVALQDLPGYNENEPRST